MAIAFARVEFGSRSSSKNACAKASYNSRTTIRFNGNLFQEPEIYRRWSSMTQPVYHEIVLPDNANKKFFDIEVLWNHAEQKETRKNSQIYFELVLALPDDEAITLEDKIKMTKSFVKQHFIDKGLGGQINIHAPAEGKNEEDKLEKESHNWHAHIIFTTRRFMENGEELGEKARDLMPAVRTNDRVYGTKWGKEWAEFQNAYFEEMGISLRVDPTGIVAQKHLGPVRMRARAQSLIEENDLLISLNKLESLDPKNILEKLTETKNIFSHQECRNFPKQACTNR